MAKAKNRTIGATTARKRQKETRPGQIVDAALESFLEYGFEGCKLDEVARRAGVAKGTVYLYFETKEHLFRAVVQQVTEHNVRMLPATITTFDGPFDQLAELILSQAANSISSSRAPAIAKLILREADRIPDLAKIWFEEVISPVLFAIEACIGEAQARGEVKAGNPRARMLSLVGPMLLAMLAKNFLGPLGFPEIDLTKLVEQHRETVLHGMLRSEGT